MHGLALSLGELLQEGYVFNNLLIFYLHVILQIPILKCVTLSGAFPAYSDRQMCGFIICSKGKAYHEYVIADLVTSSIHFLKGVIAAS